METAYRFGIEEEYFLADAATRGTPRRRALDAFHASARERLPGAERELLQSQVEASTPPSASFAEAREVLAGLRAGLAGIARENRLLVFAAGTHPIARWARQSHTQKDRYERLTRELRLVGKRNVVCGMHVHVEVPRPDARVDLMNRLTPFVPLLLALSVASPFWQCRATGLAGYRMSVFGEMPRTGLPPFFDGAADYERFVRLMTEAGAIPDASFLWWAVRPSLKYPTLELRVADSCTSLDHTLAVAALWRCLVRLVDRRPDLHGGLTGASRAVAVENLWRAQRDGARAELIDEAGGGAAPVAEHLERTLAMLAEDAEALGCADEAAAARRIVEAGTSADRQVAAFEEARGRGLSEHESLAAVVDWLASETAPAAAPPGAGRGLDSPPIVP